MARVALVAAALVDAVLAVLAIGFPDALDLLGGSEIRLTSLGVFAVAAPLVGYALSSFGRPVGGILIAWLPTLVALFMAVSPPLR
jgi:hypothetical protein